jgi:hypothetical protein
MQSTRQLSCCGVGGSPPGRTRRPLTRRGAQARRCPSPATSCAAPTMSALAAPVAPCGRGSPLPAQPSLTLGGPPLQVRGHAGPHHAALRLRLALLHHRPPARHALPLQAAPRRGPTGLAHGLAAGPGAGPRGGPDGGPGAPCTDKPGLGTGTETETCPQPPEEEGRRGGTRARARARIEAGTSIGARSGASAHASKSPV